MSKGCLFTIVLVLGFSSLKSQVSSVDYLLEYNCETNVYDVFLKINEGSATTIPQRAQFNSQISFVIPTGEDIDIVEYYMPLQDNQFYDGTVPLNWTLGSGLISPSAQPESDFYGVTPTLSPASFYHDLNVGDVVHLFSISVGNAGQYDERVRFFNNNDDPDFSSWGSGDYSNGFTLGGPKQLYHSNASKSCLTSIETQIHTSVQSYPNPCTNYLVLDSDEEIIDVKIIGIDGKIYYQTDMIYTKTFTIETDHFPKGLYYLMIDTNEGTSTNKIVKI